MKKILVTLIVLFMVTAFVKAQTNLKTFGGSATDVLTASDTVILTSDIIKSYQKTVQIALYVDKVSGNLSGKAILQGSLDGVKFYDLLSDTLVNQAAYVYAWKLENWSSLYLRVKVINTNTGTANIESKYFIRREYQ